MSDEREIQPLPSLEEDWVRRVFTDRWVEPEAVAQAYHDAHDAIARLYDVLETELRRAVLAGDEVGALKIAWRYGAVTSFVTEVETQMDWDEDGPVDPKRLTP